MAVLRESPWYEQIFKEGQQIGQQIGEQRGEHILNALRIAVLDKIITPDDLSILYFQRNSEQPVVQIPVQPNGGIEEWPEGFFDQIDKDFSRLFGI